MGKNDAFADMLKGAKDAAESNPHIGSDFYAGLAEIDSDIHATLAKLESELLNLPDYATARFKALLAELKAKL